MTIKQLNSTFATRSDLLKILTLLLAAIAIYYPLFYTEYAYTDDWFALWQHGTGKGMHGLTPYGRYFTDALTNWLYTYVNARTVHDLVFIRLFSFFGWIVCIPVWYFIIKKIVTKENLPTLLIFFSTLYIICTPPFTICVGWASCFQQFIPTTAGLISGYIVYSSIKDQNNRISIPFLAIGFSLLFGLISLFTYQNGFGCFLIPFFLHLVATPKTFRNIFIGIGFYFFVYVVYYLLFRLSLKVNHIEASARTSIHVDVFPKLKFFFTQPLATAFQFTYLGSVGFFVSLLIFLGWLIADFYRWRFLPIAKRLKMVVLILSMFILIYMPSLIVKEIYAPNRTLFALNMAVFFLIANTLLNLLKNHKWQVAVVSVLSALFVINAWYNFNKQFLGPIRNEYEQVRAFIEQSYNPKINTVYVIRPSAVFFKRKFGTTPSWDEFGVPSTFPDWTPEFFVRQVIFEKTGDRSKAENMTIRNWLGEKEFGESALPLSQNIMVVDVEDILNQEYLRKRSDPISQ